LLYLPLDKIMQLSASGEAGAAVMNAPALPASTSPVSTAPAAGAADARSRDTARSREREVR
jgi:membrane protease subunit HflK